MEELGIIDWCDFFCELDYVGSKASMAGFAEELVGFVFGELSGLFGEFFGECECGEIANEDHEDHCQEEYDHCVVSMWVLKYGLGSNKLDMVIHEFGVFRRRRSPVEVASCVGVVSDAVVFSPVDLSVAPTVDHAVVGLGPYWQATVAGFDWEPVGL